MENSITALLLWCALQGVGGQRWSVDLPEYVIGLEGSCVKIPCKFMLREDLNYLLDTSCEAKWFRGWERDIVFDSSLTEDVKLGQGQLVGNLLDKDCTTILHNLSSRNNYYKYYFRIECYNALKITFYPGVEIDVKDVMSPVSSGQVAVQEGSPVTLSCSAEITCPLLPPTFSWAPSLGDAKEEVTATLVTSVLTFNASFRHHGEKIICSSLYKRQAGHSDISFEKRRTINVLYPPTNVSVEWPSGPVVAGKYVRLSCKCSANPPVDSYAWYRSRLHPGPDQRPDQGLLGFNQNFRVLVSEDTQFYCRVRNRYGAQNSSLTQMDVHFPPKEVELRVKPPGVVLQGLGFTLRCSSQAQPPASEYNWYWVSGGTPGVRIHLPDHGANFTVEQAEQRHGGQYYCLAGNYLGEIESAPFHLDILFAAKILSSSSYCVGLPSPSGVRCTCESHGNPVPSLTWQLAGEAVNHSLIAQWPIREFPIDNLGIISFISLAQSDEYPPTVVCRSNNSVGADSLDLNLPFVQTQPAFHAVSLLIGWAAGAVVMMLLWALFHVTFCRKKKGQLSKETSELVRAEQMEVVYASKAAQGGGGEEEDLHYVDVRFVMLHSPLDSNPDIIRGMDSKTAVYAQIHPHQTGSGNGEPQEENVYAETVSSAWTGAGEEVMAERSLSDAKDVGGNLVTGHGTNFDP